MRVIPKSLISLWVRDSNHIHSISERKIRNWQISFPLYARMTQHGSMDRDRSFRFSSGTRHLDACCGGDATFHFCGWPPPDGVGDSAGCPLGPANDPPALSNGRWR